MYATIQKVKGSDRYIVCHYEGTKSVALCTPMEKKKALHLAAELSGMSYNEYMKEYRKNGV